MTRLRGVVAQGNTLMIELKARGHRMTKARRAVLDVILREQTHLSPMQVFERARKLHPPLGIVTVYRTLDLLEVWGLVQRVHSQTGCHSYARTSRGHSHQLICNDCGRVEEFSNCDIDKLRSTLEHRTGFVVEHHWLELEGRCPVCQLTRSSG